MILQTMILRLYKVCNDSQDLTGVLSVLGRCLYDRGIVLRAGLGAEASAELEFVQFFILPILLCIDGRPGELARRVQHVGNGAF